MIRMDQDSKSILKIHIFQSFLRHLKHAKKDNSQNCARRLILKNACTNMHSYVNEPNRDPA
jgi:hypothetical protein